MEFLEVPLFDDDIAKLGVRFLLDIFFLSLIVVYAIYPNQSNRDFAFTAVMMNITAFFICFTLKKLELGLGMALGLFAIFGILRYRTDTIRTKEMTYLFIVIGVAVINSLSNKKTSYVELLAVNSIILVAALLKEKLVARRQQRKQTIQYDKINLLGPANRAELLADIRERTGIEAVRIDIKSVDLRKSTATIVIWYDGNGDVEEEK